MSDKNIRDTMNIFTPSEAQKERIYEKVMSGEKEKRTGRGRLVWACAAVACAVLAVATALALSGPGKPDNAEAAQAGGSQTQQAPASIATPSAAQTDTTFSGFMLTAYTPVGGTEYLGADYEQVAEPVSLAPDVKVLLAKYSPLMSSVPGLPFTINILDGSTAEAIRIAVNGGTLCEWDQATGVVAQKGNSAEIAAGGTIYWSPLGEGSSDICEATITVEAVANDAVVGRQEIRITQDNQGYYCATAGKPEGM